MPRWFRNLLWGAAGCAAIAAAGYGALVWSIGGMTIDFTGAVYKEWDARTAIMLDLSEPECLTRGDVIDQAEAKGWPVADEPNLAFCTDPGGLTDWLRVTMPEGEMLPPHPENATFFGFDAMGCSQYWTEQACPAE